MFRCHIWTSRQEQLDDEMSWKWKRGALTEYVERRQEEGEGLNGKLLVVSMFIPDDSNLSKRLELLESLFKATFL